MNIKNATLDKSPSAIKGQESSFKSMDPDPQKIQRTEILDRNAEMRNFDNLVQYFGLIAFFDDGQCLDKNEIIIKIVI